MKSLKITDLRVAVITRAPMTCPLIRIDTNQEGLYGLGEVRDGASKTYALMLKSRLLGDNPLDVDRLFRKLKQFGHHARQAGGVCAVEMALWDIVGKYYGVPVYQLLGGKFRDKVRVYADTDLDPDPAVTAQRLKRRMDQGFTFLKMDFIRGNREKGTLETLYGSPPLPPHLTLRDVSNTQHMFTGMEISDAGIAQCVEYMAEVRRLVGWEIPLAADHFGHIGVSSCIRLGRALEPFQLAWLEDLIPWQYTALWKRITDAVQLPTCTGEDIYLKEGFIELCRHSAVDIIHPDLATSGGILETKKIGDAAQEFGIPMAMHFAGTPVSCMANVHCAAATENFLVLENHSVDVPWWDDLVEGISKPIVENGFIKVPDTPGLGITLKDEVAIQHLLDERYFEPTPEWDDESSADRLWS
ncbi:mandelate racemase/muconate lactonizing enzyme family protein [Armatimonas sp.]|uniref:mandelate racemase/muconate lactonizing enzyme family protein n=1 Tax=Armatimonas sp. TaxID=1872638 RepID=UPI0037518BDE